LGGSLNSASRHEPQRSERYDPRRLRLAVAEAPERHAPCVPKSRPRPRRPLHARVPLPAWIRQAEPQGRRPEREREEARRNCQTVAIPPGRHSARAGRRTRAAPPAREGGVDDWRGRRATRGVAVGRHSRCLSPHRRSRFQSPLIEPDMRLRIRLSDKVTDHRSRETHARRGRSL